MYPFDHFYPAVVEKALMESPLPKDESARLEALYRYRILDTPSEESFDELARLAAEICGMPIALISLLDRERQRGNIPEGDKKIGEKENQQGGGHRDPLQDLRKNGKRDLMVF